MRVTVATLLAGLVVLLAGCSDSAGAPTTGPTTTPTTTPTASTPTGDSEAEALAPLWEHSLFVPVNSYGTGVMAVSQGHWLATGSLDNSAGMYNPTPNVQLDYGIGDAETGQVESMKPLGYAISTVQAVPGTDLFVAVAGDRVGVLDPATSSFVWRGRAIGTEIVAMSSSRIWMGRSTDDGQPICLTVPDGSVVSHDTACRAAGRGDPEAVDGVRRYDDVLTVDLPGGDQVDVPVTYASDEVTSEQLWTYGGLSVRLEGEGLGYETSEFVRSDLGLVRVDYSRAVEVPEQGERTWSDAVLHLVDARTGEVTRTLGRVPDGTLVAFAGPVAIFEHPGDTVAGYRVTP